MSNALAKPDLATSTMLKNWCRRYQKLILVFVLICLTFACYNAQTVTGMFDKGREAFCDKENCGDEKDDEKTLTEPTSVTAGKPRNHKTGNDGADNATKQSEDAGRQSDTESVNLIITFTNAEGNYRLHEKFRLTVSSLLRHASVPLAIHIIGERKSQKIAAGILEDASVHAKSSYKLVELDVDKLAKQLQDVVKPMQDHFSAKPGAYYNHALFFLSIAMHRVMPESMEKVIMIDCDLKFRADIRQLYERFALFESDNVMAIGRDMQPVYRHTFWSYRRKHPGTRVGDPPPNGLTGFNSGVLLLDLTRMRRSELYNSHLNRQAVEKLASEFEFKGHLGDQDFFSLLSMRYEQLFHVLPCEWNRQLCVWWRDKGYADVFDDYFRCDADVKIYHGNCNTPIPDD